MKTIYLARHCRASGQAPDAPLTPEGLADAERLAGFLAPLGVERVVSSPYVRAVQSVEPLATRLGVTVEVDERFVEWKLSATPAPSYEEFLVMIQTGFADPNKHYEGGETGSTLTARAVAGIGAVFLHPAKVTAVSLHGGILSHLIRHYKPSFGFDDWQSLTNPDVYRLTLRDDAEMVECVRVWAG